MSARSSSGRGPGAKQRHASGGGDVGRDVRPGAAGEPEAEHPSAPVEQVERLPGDGAADAVEDHVERVDGGPHPPGPVRLPVVDHHVDRGGAEQVDLGGAAGGGHHRRAGPRDELHQQGADPAGRGLHQYPVAGPQPGRPSQHQRGPAVGEQRHGPVQRQPGGYGDGRVLVDHDALGVPAGAAGAGDDESADQRRIDSGADRADRAADPVAGDQRRFAGERAEPGGPEHRLEEGQVRVRHLDEHLTRTGLRVGRRTGHQHLGSAEFSQPHRTHRASRIVHLEGVNDVKRARGQLVDGPTPGDSTSRDSTMVLRDEVTNDSARSRSRASSRWAMSAARRCTSASASPETV